MRVTENIGLGDMKHFNELSRIEEAACLSHAHDIIMDLPNKYSQMLGSRFEGGIELSTGQWQKIALARCYLRQAQVLILDEPTASLDAKGEYEVFQQFSDVTDGRTALLISHRFSTVRMADLILLFSRRSNHRTGHAH
jgi:ATP-binding cassette subfamily B protein